MILGSHVSMKAPDYFLGSVKEAIAYGANTFMIYTGPPANSKRVSVDKFHISQAKELMKEKGMDIQHIIIHAPYIINLANSIKPETAQFGVSFLLEEINRVSQIGANIIVLHPGSHLKAGVNTGIEWISNGLNEVLNQDTHEDIFIALETMAGKGAECGRTFEELAQIIQRIDKKERIKVCLDTCHIHDAGYDLTKFDDVLEEFDRIIGLDRLAVLHINDSKNERGSHKDRHANIGEGTIGFDAIYKIVHHPKLQHIPMILETPYINGNAPYKDEIAKLKG